MTSSKSWLAYETVNRACRALTDPAQETFTRAQVAHVISIVLDVKDAAEFEAGYRFANDQLVAGLTHALGGPDARDYSEAVGRHTRAVEQRQARERWDAEACTPRPGDYQGGPVAWDDGTTTTNGARITSLPAGAQTRMARAA